MKRYALAALSLTAAFGLLACGEDTTTNNYTTTEIDEIASKKLPDCEKENQGKIYFVSDKEELQICMDGDWKSLNGVDGEKGDKGEKGEQGETGVKGNDGESCEAQALKDKSGYKILCGGDSVGVVLHGEKGDKGDQGETGEKGDDGASCQMTPVTDKGDTAAMVICKQDTVYLLNGKNADGSSAGGSGTGGSGTGEGGGPQTSLTEGSMPNGLVIIGNQVWKGQNENDATKGGACYNNKDVNCERFGRLYSWAEAMAIDTSYNHVTAEDITTRKNYQGICPDGFHIPTPTDWSNLRNYVNGTQKARELRIANEFYEDTDVSSMILRSTEYDGNGELVWTSKANTLNGVDSYGFMIVGSGWGELNWHEDWDDQLEDYVSTAKYEGFEAQKERAYFWTNLEHSDREDGAYYTSFHYDDSGMFSSDWQWDTKNILFSVRCIMNMSAADYMKTDEYKNLFNK